MQSENPKPKPNSDEHERQDVKRLKTLLEALATTFRIELTTEAQRIYLPALMDVPPAVMEKAVIEGVKTWRFFPSIGEIIEAVDRVRADPEVLAKAYAELQTRYVNAYLGEGPPKSLPSALEPAPTVETFTEWHQRLALQQGWLSMQISTPGGGMSEKDRKALAKWDGERKGTGNG